MTTAALPSARKVTWLRRRRALAGLWREFRGHRPGMIGLAILIAVVVMALAAPLLADSAGLKATNSTDNPVFASPSEFGPLGTDDLGRDVMTQFIWGSRISLLVGLVATLIAMLIGSAVGITAGFFGGLGRVGPDAHHRVVLGDPVPTAGHRSRRDPRALDPEHHPRDRDHLVAVHHPRSSTRRCSRSRNATTSTAAARWAPRTGT